MGKKARAESEEMRAAKLQELEAMAAKLLATARELSPGQERHEVLQESRQIPFADNCFTRRRFTTSAPGAEGEGEIDGLAFVDRIAALANDRGSYFNSDGLPRSCIYPEQGSCG
jgi:hypothetical protein